MHLTGFLIVGVSCPTPLDLLGNRMEREENGAYSEHACLCYICSGNVDKFIDCW